jgi:hypothetical protein
LIEKYFIDNSKINSIDISKDKNYLFVALENGKIVSLSTFKNLELS